MKEMILTIEDSLYINKLSSRKVRSLERNCTLA